MPQGCADSALRAMSGQGLPQFQLFGLCLPPGMARFAGV